MSRAGALGARDRRVKRLRERKPWLFDGHYVVYEARFPDGSCYIGRTGQKLSDRIAQHREAAAAGRDTAVCCALRRFRPTWHILWEGKNYFESQGREIAFIKQRQQDGIRLLNLTRGGFYDRRDSRH